MPESLIIQAFFVNQHSVKLISNLKITEGVSDHEYKEGISIYSRRRL